MNGFTIFKLLVIIVGLVIFVSSTMTLISESYAEYQEYYEAVMADKEYQKLVTKGICNTKNINRFTIEDNEENPVNCFKKTKRHLLSLGAEVIISGCTDIRVTYSEEENIDSLEILKRQILKECKYYEK